jgi:PhnB protein
MQIRKGETIVTAKKIPDRYQFAVVPHIFINGASGAIKFYKQAFDADELFRVSKPDGKIVHAEIKIGDSAIMVGDADGVFRDPRALSGVSVGLHLYTDDVDALFARALGAGARQIQPVQDMFYGDRMGMLEDPYGHVWVFLTHKEDVAPDEIKRRGEAMFT